MTGDTLLKPLLTRRGLEALWLMFLIYQLVILATGILLLLQWLPQFRSASDFPASMAPTSLTYALLGILAPLVKIAAARVAVAVADAVLFGRPIADVAGQSGVD